MKNTIGQKLIYRGLFVLGLIFIIAVAGQISVQVLKNTSNKIVTEYIELDAIQELKLALNNILITANNYISSGDSSQQKHFNHAIETAYANLEKCDQDVTEYHDKQHFAALEEDLGKITHLGDELFSLSYKQEYEAAYQIDLAINDLIFHNISNINHLLDETKIEIDDFVQINKKVINHSTITLVALGIIILCIVIIGGSLFIQKLISPIKELVHSTNRISEGDLSTKVNISSEDELGVLANSFNNMVEALEKTTVSRNYLDSILRSMSNPLIVTNIEGKIRLVNQATIDILGFKKNEYLEKNIQALIYPKFHDEISFLSLIQNLKTEEVFNSDRFVLKTIDDVEIPVKVSASVMYKPEHKDYGFVFIIDDLREKIAQENKLERSRKETQILINEAQELEKLRISREIHDGLGQVLTAISYALQNYFENQKPRDKVYKQHLKELQEQVDYAINESKAIAHNLIPIVLKDFGLNVAVKKIIDQANGKSNINIRLETTGLEKRFDSKLEKAVYRICQEALNNIIKHSDAHNANFLIAKYEDALVIVIEDDGKGFDTEAYKLNKQKGIGLIGIKDRTDTFNGNFTINTEIGNGTELVIEIPCVNH